jgi:protein gp37
MEKRFHKGIEGQILTHPERLSIPLKRRKPTVFSIWNDLFHEAVPFAFIEEAFEIMRGTYPRHDFLILTKRPERMVKYWQWRKDFVLSPGQNSVWPENAHPGLTVCNQQEADEKIPGFLQVPGKKFLSIEPMLSEIDLFEALGGFDQGLMIGPHVDAVILGGETGPGARPMQIDWAWSVYEQCKSAGVPFFFKSFGKYCPSVGDSRVFTLNQAKELPWQREKFKEGDA